MGTEVIYYPNGSTETVVHPDPPARPRLLTKTQFQDYAVSKLGGIPNGMSRFTEIMDATRDSASGAVRFCFARYEAAATFEKENTAQLTQIMVNGGTMDGGERTDIIDGWPTS